MANFPSSFPAVIEYVTVSPSGSVADMAPTEVLVPALSGMVSVWDDGRNVGARLHASVVSDSGSDGWPQSETYVVRHRRRAP